MKYQLLEHVSLSQVDDEIVLLDLNSGAYYGLNSVGSLLLNSFQDGATLDEAIAIIADQYQASVKQVTTDAHVLVEQLLQQSLIGVRAS